MRLSAPPAAGEAVRGTGQSGRAVDLTVARALGRSTALVGPGDLVARRVSARDPRALRALLGLVERWAAMRPTPHVLPLWDAIVLGDPGAAAADVLLLTPYAASGKLCYRASRSPKSSARLVAAVAAGADALMAAGIGPHGAITMDHVLLDTRGAPRLAGLSTGRGAGATEAGDVRALAALLYELVGGVAWSSRSAPARFPGPPPIQRVLEIVLGRESKDMSLVAFRYELAAARGLVPQCEEALPPKMAPSARRKVAILSEDLNSVSLGGGVTSTALGSARSGGSHHRPGVAHSTPGLAKGSAGGMASGPSGAAVNQIVEERRGAARGPSTNAAGDPSASRQTAPEAVVTSPAGPEHAAAVLRVTDPGLEASPTEEINFVCDLAKKQPTSQRAVFTILFKCPIGKKPVVAIKSLSLLHYLMWQSQDFCVLVTANDGFMAWIESEWSKDKAEKNQRRENGECFPMFDPSMYSHLLRRKALFHRDYPTVFSPAWKRMPGLNTHLGAQHDAAISSVLDIVSTVTALLTALVTATDPALPVKGGLVPLLALELSAATAAAAVLHERSTPSAVSVVAQARLDAASVQTKRTLRIANDKRDRLGLPAAMVLGQLLGPAPVTSGTEGAPTPAPPVDLREEDDVDGGEKPRKSKKKKLKKKKVEKRETGAQSLDDDSGEDVRKERRDDHSKKDKRRDEYSAEPYVGLLEELDYAGHSDQNRPSNGEVGHGGEKVNPYVDAPPPTGPMSQRRRVAAERSGLVVSARGAATDAFADENAANGQANRRNEETNRRAAKGAVRKQGKQNRRHHQSLSSDSLTESSGGESHSASSSEDERRTVRSSASKGSRRSKHSADDNNDDQHPVVAKRRKPRSDRTRSSSSDDEAPRERRRKPKDKENEASRSKSSTANGTKKDARRAAPVVAAAAGVPVVAGIGAAASSDAPRGSAAALAAAASGRKTPRMDRSFEIEPHEVQFGKQIGSGGFGVVFKGKYRGETVAIKKIHANALGNQSSIAEFQSEVAVLSTLKHPNILRFMAACVKPPNLMIVTEFMARGTLFDVLHRSQMKVTWPMRRRMALDTCKGVRYLHDSQLLHRDLKSSNLMLDDQFKCAVGDFGLTRISRGAIASQMTGQCGTYQYMAPEILRNMPYSEKADVFSFGILLWELVARKLPFFGMQPLQVGIAVSQKGLRPTMPPKTPEPLIKLIRACWHEEPNRRPSMEQVQTILEAMPDA